MFCTTECWICEDKNCKNYISKQELYFDNQLLKSVLDEIREYIVENIQHCTYGEVPKYQDILQILDKVEDL